LVCGDTIVEDIPKQEHRDRPWGPCDNPKTALNAFMKETNRFEVDADLENKLLFSCNPGGYLRCIED
jgi:cephalosporin hydroxylase